MRKKIRVGALKRQRTAKTSPRLLRRKIEGDYRCLICGEADPARFYPSTTRRCKECRKIYRRNRRELQKAGWG